MSIKMMWINFLSKTMRSQSRPVDVMLIPPSGTYKSINHTIKQSIDKYIKQSIDRSFDPSLTQSLKESIT